MFKRFFILIVLSFFLLIDRASAFTISPLRYDLSIAPGEKQTVSIDIKNNEDQDFVVTPIVMGVKQDASGKSTMASGIDKAESWIEIDSKQTVIAKGKEGKIYFVVSAPLGAAPGSHYLGLGVEKKSVSSLGNVVLGGRLFTLAVVRVAGTVNEKLDISRWQTNNFAINKNWVFDLELKNSGNIEIPVTAVVNIFNAGGDKIFTAPVVMPGTLLSAAVRQQKISTVPAVFWPGKYNAEIKTIHGITNQATGKIIQIWYFPIWSIVSFFILLVGIFFSVKIKARWKAKI